MLVTIAAFAVFIWTLVKQGNVGPLWNKPDDSFDVEVSKSDISWTMMWMTTRGVGTWASGILYQSGKQTNNSDCKHYLLSTCQILPDMPNDLMIKFGVKFLSFLYRSFLRIFWV